jgi:hypothetical protein
MCTTRIAPNNTGGVQDAQIRVIRSDISNRRGPSIMNTLSHLIDDVPQNTLIAEWNQTMAAIEVDNLDFFKLFRQILYNLTKLQELFKAK